MKSLREHVTESLAFGTVKDLHARMTAHAKEHLPGVLPALQDGIRDTARIMRSKFEGGSLHDAAVDHLSDHLHDNFQDHPKYTPDLARKVAKQVVRDPRHGADDRRQFADVRKQHYSDQRRKAAIERVRGEREDFKTAIAGRPTATIQSDINLHKDLAATYKDKDPKAASHHRFMVRAHSNELKRRGANPDSRSSTKKSTVYDYTKRGLVARKLPPFQKA